MDSVFSLNQQQRLTRLGLIDTQIRALERKLPLVRSILTRPARVADIRQVLQPLQNALKKADRILSRLLNAGDSSSDAQRQALVRLINFDDDNELGEAIKKANDLLLRAMPRASKHKSATAVPVALIDRALLNGFIRKPLIDEKTGDPYCPAYTIKRSSSQGSPYREIIGICYEAATGQRDVDPERAIRAFIAQEKARTKAGRAAMKISTKGISSSALALELTKDGRAAKKIGTVSR